VTVFRPARHWPYSTAVGRLTADGKVFRLDGTPWRYKGVTAFKLCELFARGEDISGFLRDYDGFNVLRVFSYTPAADWGAQAWSPPTAGMVLAFLEVCAARGFWVEFVLLTDDDPAQIEPSRRLIDSLAAAQPANLLLEIGNEPITHKTIITESLHSACAASGFLYSSGDYEDSDRWFGTYYTCHTARTEDWPRRAHDLMEFYDGSGPDKPTVPHHVPCVADEPIRPDQAGYHVQDFRAYFGASSILGAGATYHCESGKFGEPPTDDEAFIAAVVLDALNAFPPDAPFGAYRRIVEPGNEPGGPTQDSRTYVVGNCMVRCQQMGTDAPEPGWTALDADGILWSR
jgi:hypothetical protein